MRMDQLFVSRWTVMLYGILWKQRSRHRSSSRCKKFGSHGGHEEVERQEVESNNGAAGTRLGTAAS